MPPISEIAIANAAAGNEAWGQPPAICYAIRAAYKLGIYATFLGDYCVTGISPAEASIREIASEPASIPEIDPRWDLMVCEAQEQWSKDNPY